MEDDEWIEVGELLRVTGISKRALVRWRDAGLIARPQLKPRPGGGSISKYPPGTPAQVRRVQELDNDRNVPRRIDAWLLIMWYEGWTVDIGPTLTRHFHKLLKEMADEEKFARAAKAISTKKVKGLRRGKQRLLKRMMARVGDLEEWAALVSLILAVARGSTPEVPLRDDSYPTGFSALLKIGGLPKDYRPPPDNLSIDNWAAGRSLVAFLREIAVQLSGNANEMERVRGVFARLALLATAVEGVPLTALPRHARRTLVARGVTITQDTIALLLDLWRDVDIRLILVPGIALLWRIAGETAEEWLSRAEAAAAMLPTKSAAESSGPQPAAVGDDVGAAIA